MNFKKILVVGFQPYDAGKTTLCKALIYGFRETGQGLVPFKPHSGISYWSQFDTFQKGLTMSTLICNDIIELEEAAQSNLPLEVLNPVNRLSSPRIYRDISEEELVFHEFIAERFTHHDGVNRKDIYHLNGILDFSQMRGLREFYQRIKKNADKTHFIQKLQDLTEAYVNNFDNATSSCYEYIKDKPLMIESFNDAAYPFKKSEDCDIVLCVSSNIILLFENKKYFKAIELHEGKKSKLQLRVTDIFEPSLIKDKFLIQPLSSQEKNDSEKLKHCYSRIIKKMMRDN